MAKYCHWLIKKTAQEMAGAWFEEHMHDDNLYKIVKQEGIDQKEFIKKCWGHFIALARICLVKSLNSATLPDMAKEDIMEALVLDKSLPEDTAVHRGIITDETARVH